MSITKKAVMILIVVTMLWGMTFPLIGLSVHTINPYSFVFFRFTVAALILLPFVANQLRHSTWLIVGGSLLLSVFNFLSYASQCVGLQTIPANESAFITSTAVIFVPIFSILFKIDSPRWVDFICALLCVVGLYLLTGANLGAISWGQIATLVCAISFAFYIILIQIITHQVSHYRLLSFYQILFTGLLALPFAHVTDVSHLFSTSVMIAFLYCVLLATLVVMHLQTKYQKYVPATKVALIFCLEPVFACFFAWMINGEPLTWPVVMGGGLILISISLPDLIKLVLSKQRRKEELVKEAVSA